MKVWEAINILESLDPKSEVTLVLNKVSIKSPNFNRDYVIGKEQWVQPAPAYPSWYNTITCHGTPH